MFPTIIDFGTLKIASLEIPIGIRSYGVMMAIAFLTVLFGLQKELPRKGINTELASSIIFNAIIGGIVGSKIYYAIEFKDFGSIFSGSGLVWYGGLIGGSGAVLFAIWRSQNPILPTIDAIAPLLLIGYAIGRIGCLLAGDGCYGTACDLPWAMSFPNGVVPTIDRVHPTPLYEAIATGSAFAILWFKRQQIEEKTPGVMFGLAIFALSFERFFVEFLRLNDRYTDLNLSGAQFFSLIGLTFAVWFIVWSRNEAKIQSTKN